MSTELNNSEIKMYADFARLSYIVSTNNLSQKNKKVSRLGFNPTTKGKE